MTLKCDGDDLDQLGEVAIHKPCTQPNGKWGFNMVCGCFLAHERDQSGLLSYFRFNDVLNYNYNHFSHGITFDNYKQGADTASMTDLKPSYVAGIKIL